MSTPYFPVFRARDGGEISLGQNLLADIDNAGAGGKMRLCDTHRVSSFRRAAFKLNTLESSFKYDTMAMPGAVSSG